MLRNTIKQVGKYFVAFSSLSMINAAFLAVYGVITFYKLKDQSNSKLCSVDVMYQALLGFTILQALQALFQLLHASLGCFGIYSNNL